MKKTFLNLCLLVCIALFGVACSNSTKLTGNEFLIEGKISGVEDGVVITLSRFDDTGVGSRIASDTIRNGRFLFKGKVESDKERFGIRPMSDGFPSMSLYVWAAPQAKIKIIGTGKLHPAWEVKSSVAYQKEENRYINKIRDVIAEQARIVVESSDLMAKIRAAASEDEVIAYRKISDSLDIILGSLFLKQLYSDIAIMEKTDVTPVWFDKIRNLASAVRYYEYYYIDIEQVDYLRKKAEEQYSRMSEEDRNSPAGYPITANIFPPDVVAVGDDFADTDLLDINGNTKRLADYLDRYLLLDFWSRGCGPCIMALPEMKEISETYRDKLTIISISLDTETGWKDAMVAHDMPWVNLRDPKSMGGLAATYGVTGIPNYVMISPEGKIIDKWMGYGTGFLKRKVRENVGF